MPANYYSITKNDLFDLFARLAQMSRIFVPYKHNDKFHFGEFDPSREPAIELGGIRQSQPIKSFINPPREKIPNDSPKDKRPLILAGVKGCDLSSLILQDFVFLKGDTEDPFYAESRNNTIIIGNDCTYAKETCCCVAMDGAPSPQ